VTDATIGDGNACVFVHRFTPWHPEISSTFAFGLAVLAFGTPTNTSFEVIRAARYTSSRDLCCRLSCRRCGYRRSGRRGGTWRFGGRILLSFWYNFYIDAIPKLFGSSDPGFVKIILSWARPHATFFPARRPSIIIVPRT